MTAFILLALGSYLLGSIPSAYLVARWRRGIDIRQYGSGNVGASNVLAAVSKWWSVPVIIFDIGKGALAVWVAQMMGLGPAQQVTVGILAVIGHNWPVFLRFRGGRGAFTTLGVVTMLSPKLGLIMLFMTYLLAPFRQLSLGVFLGLVALPFFSWFLAAPLGIAARLPVTIGFIALALIGMTRRILAPRTTLSASVHPAELFFNRMILDRDIRDRKLWISQTRTDTGASEKHGLKTD